MRHIWAALERLIARGASALTGLVVAAITSPSDFGNYSWMVIALTLFQALLEQPARQLAPSLIRTKLDAKLLKPYTWVSSIAGVLALSLVAAIVAWESSTLPALGIFVALSPMVFTPLPLMASIRPMAILQASGHWSVISRARATGAITGVGVGICATLMTGSIIGASLSVVISEIVFWALIHHSARRVRAAEFEAMPLIQPPLRALLHFSLYSSLGWLQGQLDRLLLGVFAGTAALGAYSLGAAVGRSPGDAVAASHANVLRIELRSTTNDKTIASLLNKTSLAGLALIASTVLGVLLLSELILPLILDEDWADALSIAPVLSLAGFPSLISWAAGPVHLQRGRTSMASWAPVFGVLVAPAIAWVAVSNSLTAAAWMVLGRECLLALIHLALMGRAAPWQTGTKVGACVLIGAAVILILP